MDTLVYGSLYSLGIAITCIIAYMLIKPTESLISVKYTHIILIFLEKFLLAFIMLLIGYNILGYWTLDVTLAVLLVLTLLKYADDCNE